MKICYSLFALLLASVLSSVAALSPEDIESLHRQQVMRKKAEVVAGGAVASDNVSNRREANRAAFKIFESRRNEDSSSSTTNRGSMKDRLRSQ